MGPIVRAAVKIRSPAVTVCTVGAIGACVIIASNSTVVAVTVSVIVACVCAEDRFRERSRGTRDDDENERPHSMVSQETAPVVR